MATKITVRTNGSIRVEGDFELFDKEGNRFDLGGRRQIALCRCGYSMDKPFCDSTHKLIGFNSEVSARPFDSAARERALKNSQTQLRLNHFHVGVRDLSAAVQWLERVWEIKPSFHNERMAVYNYGPLSFILDAAEQDTPATIGFASQECDTAYNRVVTRGAQSLEGPANRPWGARAAYIKGPGAMKFEIEGPLKQE
jgi:CDGSH-type Zn-finger protein